LMDAVRRVGLSLGTRRRSGWSSTRSVCSCPRPSPDLGQASRPWRRSTKGEDITAAFNPTYLADGLAAAAETRSARGPRRVEARDREGRGGGVHLPRHAGAPPAPVG
jgi:hypothetical protein